MKKQLAFLVSALALALLVSGPVTAKGKTKPKKAEKPPAATQDQPKKVVPWSLREQYSFTIGTSVLTYAVETAEWKLSSEKIGDVIEDASFRITFADGSKWDSSNMGKATSSREPFTSDLGNGTNFCLEFPPKDGVIVRCNLMLYADQPYFFVKFAIGNTGSKPIEIAKIAPAVFAPNGIHGLSAGADVAARHIVARDSFPVFNPIAPGLMMFFDDRANAFAMALGIMPMGISAPDVSLDASNGAWQGEIACVYSPPVRIEPKQKFDADPMWICAGLNTPAKIDTYFAWAWRTLRPQKLNGEVPRAWATAEGAAKDADVVSAAKEWGGAQVKFALVPPVWEGRPGSLEGSTPNFPKNMAKMAEQLHGIGTKAGITVDPLLAGGGPNTAASADGRKWFNLSSPEGMKAAAERLQKVVGWGFDFFAVVQSDIPDDVLKQFNITRTQTDNLAFAVMAQAAGPKPVLPVAAATLKGALDTWLEAAACSGRMAEFQVAPGPVRLDAGGLDSLDETVLDAMTLFNGPIELVGAPNARLQRQLADLLAQSPIPARPVDTAEKAPKIWQVVPRGEGDARGGSVIAFPGGRAWNVSELDVEKDRPVRLWNPGNGKFLELDKGAVAAAGKLTVYGVMPVVPHPSVMGASKGLDLLLNDLGQPAWNEDKRVLSGSFRGSNREAATAYVNVPEGWTFKSGKTGKAAVQKEVGDRVTFTVDASAPTSFHLEFAKK